MYETLLNLIIQTSKSFLYFAVGSCPHVRTVQDLTPRWDQLLPCFVKEIAQNKREKIQILHIDPQFANSLDFLKEYFALHLPEAIFYDMGSIYVWESSHIQVLCAATHFHHPSRYSQENEEWFLEALIDDALSHSHRMVYQEYTGYETNTLFVKLYKQYNEALRRRFRSQILFDVSYGNDTGCSTDMTKYKPIYEPNGMFLNIQLLTNQELLEKVDAHPSIREILCKNLVGEFRRLLNEIHVDYRRKMNGDPLFHPQTYGYDDFSSTSQIMGILKEQLFNLVPLLQKIGLLSSDEIRKLNEYFLTYETVDRYKWYDMVFKLVKFDPPGVHAPVQ